MLAFRSLRAAIACRKAGVLCNALCARLGFFASLSLAAGGALAQDHYDVAGTRIPAFVLLDGCLSEGACAGPNGPANPLFVAPATAASWGVTAAPSAFADGWSLTEGTKADPAYAGAGAASVVALLKGLYGEFTAIVAGQPALNGDGGALSHVANWPSTWAVTGAFWPYTLNGDGGVPSHVTNWPSTQPVGAAPGAFADGALVTEGTTTDAACALPASTTACSVEALLKAIGNIARTINSTLGSPFQAGGSIGNTTFGATQGGTWQVTPQIPAVSTLNLTANSSAYTAGQLIANNATAGSVTSPSITFPAAGGAAPRLRLWSDDTTATAWAGASVQIDLWDAAPTWTNGDHAAWLPATGSAHHIAAYSCAFPAAVWGDGIATECTPNQGSYASIVATTVYWSAEATSGSGVLGGSKHLNLKVELN